MTDASADTVRAVLKPTLVVALVLAVSSCSSTDGNPAPTPTSVSGTSILLAVAPEDGGLDLYRAGSNAEAVKVATLKGPAYHPYAQVITMAAAVDPAICVLWSEREEQAERPLVQCYEPKTSAGLAPETYGGVPVKGLPDDVSSIALSADGRQLAWLDPEPAPGRENRVLVVTGPLAQDRTVRPLRKVAPEGASKRQVPDSEYLTADEVLWAGSTALVVTACCTSDRPEERVVPLDDASVRGGWLEAAIDVGYVEQDPTWEDEFVIAADDRTAILRQRNPFAENGSTTDRVIRVDRRTGKLLQVLALPGTGRQFTRVTGGERGLVFTTDLVPPDEGEAPEPAPETFLLPPGQTTGRPLTGMPEGAFVVAQP